MADSNKPLPTDGKIDDIDMVDKGELGDLGNAPAVDYEGNEKCKNSRVVVNNICVDPTPPPAGGRRRSKKSKKSVKKSRKSAKKSKKGVRKSRKSGSKKSGGNKHMSVGGNHPNAPKMDAQLGAGEVPEKVEGGEGAGILNNLTLPKV